MNIKQAMKLVGIVITSTTLVACGGTDPVKTEKVWRLVEKVTDTGAKTILEYDGSGNIIKQTNASGYYLKYNYDDKGKLISRDDFYKSGKLNSRYGFDSHGEMITKSVPDTNGVIVPSVSYINTYDEDRVIPDDVAKSYSGKRENITLIPYPNSKLITRTAENLGLFLRYTYEGNKVILKRYDTLTSTTAIEEINREYNEQGDLVGYVRDMDGDGPEPPRISDASYTYTPDPNKDGNISESVLVVGGRTHTMTYRWEQMDIPVK